MAVSVAAISPPVQLSAVAIRRPAARQAASSASASASVADPISAGLRRDPAGADGVEEQRVVALRLVGVGEGEVGDRGIERPPAADIAGDPPDVARPRMRPRERPAA